MSLKSRILVRATMLVSFGLSQAISASADSVGVSIAISGPSGGLFTYQYTLQNNASDSLYGFNLLLNNAVLVAEVTSPLEWTAVVLQGSVQWFSLDQSFDLVSGSSLPGFGFLSTSPPGSIDTAFLFSDPLTGAPTNVEFGQTMGPSVAVPEPVSLLQAMIGLAAMYATFRKARGMHRPAVSLFSC